MSQFFWTVKLRVLLNHLPLISDYKTQEGEDEPISKQLNCLQQWVAEGLTNPFIDSRFTCVNCNPVAQVDIPLDILTCPDARKVFWWFWRCYPQFIEDRETSKGSKSRFDAQGSIWSQASVSTALKSSWLGYFNRLEDYSTPNNNIQPSLPYLAGFTFTAIQHLIPANCALQNIQIDSWLSHYLAAKICWKVAWKYGPDIFLSPSLYGQPLIDYWLLQQYPEFSQWIAAPTETSRSRAGFPNLLMMLLPNNGAVEEIKGNPIWAAMLYAEQVLKQEWLTLAQRSLDALRHQNPERYIGVSLRADSGQETQWHAHWVALAVGDRPLTPDDAQTSLMDQVRQQLEIASYSQGWKILTAFNTQSLQPEPARVLDHGSTVNTWNLVTQGFPQVVPSLLEVSQPAAIARMMSDCRPQSAQWHLFAAAGGGLETQNLNHDAELAAYAAHHRRLTPVFTQQLVDLVEQRYGGRLICANTNEILLSGTVQGWEHLLWELHHCLNGEAELGLEQLTFLERLSSGSRFVKPQASRLGWQCLTELPPQSRLYSGVALVIAHSAVPLPVVLNHLWGAKSPTANLCPSKPMRQNGVRVCVLDQNGQTQVAMAGWQAFDQWRSLIEWAGLEPELFEQMASCWRRHPAPSVTAIPLWVTTICQEMFKAHSGAGADAVEQRTAAPFLFREKLTQFLDSLWRSESQKTHDADELLMGDRQIQSWLDLAAFTVRNR